MSKTLDEVRLDLPHLLGPLPGPRAQAMIERDQRVISPSYTRCYPLVVERGEGCMIEDVDGNRFLDFNAGIAVVATGHCHPRVVEAIQKQAARLIHMSGTDFYYEGMVALAEKLAAIAPGGVERRVSFGNSGAEAMEGAIKLARYATGRDKIIAFFGGFHGRTMGALSLTAQQGGAARGLRPADPGRGARAVSLLLPLPVRQAARFLRCGVREIHRRHPAADHRAGRRRPRPLRWSRCKARAGTSCRRKKFFDELARVAKQHGILLIFDEVQSGMGRTGKMWAAEHFDAVPDIMAVAKGIASGMPLGATVARAGADDVAAGSARFHVRRQSGGVRGGPRDHRAARRGADRERRAHGRVSDGTGCATGRRGLRAWAMCAGWD